MKKLALLTALIFVFCAGNVFAMGKKDGSEKDVKQKAERAEPQQEKEMEKASPAESHKHPAPKPAAKMPAEPKPQPVAPKQESAAIVQEPAETVETSPDTVMAVVNGDKITQADVDKEIQPQLERLSSMGQGGPRADKMKQQLRKRGLEMIIMQKLLTEKVEEKNIEISQDEIDEKFAEIAEQSGRSMDEIKQQAMQHGMSAADMDDKMKMGLAVEKLIEKEMEGSIENADEEEAKAFFEENKDKYSKPEMVKASHILISTRELKDDAEKAEAKKKAEEILAKIKEGGNFEELAKEYSDCPSKSQGGDLGFFPKERMVPEFSEAAFALEPGEISDVVETQFGYHIIKVADQKDPETNAYEDVKDEIKQTMLNQKKREFANNYMKGLREEAEIAYPGREEDAPKPVIIDKAKGNGNGE